MESTEKLADDYAQIVKESMEADGVDMTGKVAGICLRMVRESFIHGMERMREEMIRWHDPKEELPPIYDNVMVKYMALDGCEHVAIAWRSAGDAGGYTYAISGTGVAINSRNVIGWREILE